MAVAKEATDAAATAFCSCYREHGQVESATTSGDSVGQCLLLLEGMRLHDEGQIIVKVPEGFAFYSLYPEQYCVAAEKWSAASGFPAERRVLVIGVRSIGTTLSAVVAATLRSLGWKVARQTVRPEGHPFERTVNEPLLGRLAGMLAPPDNEGMPALVVDEGPGLSGSSMAAVAEWLNRSGIANVAFLPGHANDPGQAACDQVRERWARTPRFCCSFEELKWNGRTLRQILSEASMRLGCGETKCIENLSAGNWRNVVYEDESQRPAIFKMLERTKFLCRGSRFSVLWKFDGLAACRQDSGDRIKSLAGDGLVAPLMDRRLGFAGMPWIEGERLQARDARNPDVFRPLIQYLVRSAGPMLTESEHRSGIERLTAMLCCNTTEAFGDNFGDEVERMKRAALDHEERVSYGDGHFAPHEWVRAGTGAIIKTDYFGHTADHTLVGKQSVLWDVAALIIEWDLNESQIEAVLRELRCAGIHVLPEALRFYFCAYAAFRMGIMSFAISNAGDSQSERSQALQDFQRYKGELGKWVSGTWSKRAEAVNVPFVSQARVRCGDQESTKEAPRARKFHSRSRH